MSRQEGPTITMTRSCDGCVWLESEYYRCQGDSGHDYMCRHPILRDKPKRERFIGDCRTVTPDWCPVLVLRPAPETNERRCLTCGQPVSKHVGFRCPESEGAVPND